MSYRRSLYFVVKAFKQFFILSAYLVLSLISFAFFDVADFDQDRRAALINLETGGYIAPGASQWLWSVLMTVLSLIITGNPEKILQFISVTIIFILNLTFFYSCNKNFLLLVLGPLLIFLPTMQDLVYHTMRQGFALALIFLSLTFLRRRETLVTFFSVLTHLSSLPFLLVRAILRFIKIDQRMMTLSSVVLRGYSVFLLSVILLGLILALPLLGQIFSVSSDYFVFDIENLKRLLLFLLVYPVLIQKYSQRDEVRSADWSLRILILIGVCFAMISSDFTRSLTLVVPGLYMLTALSVSNTQLSARVASILGISIVMVII